MIRGLLGNKENATHRWQKLFLINYRYLMSSPRSPWFECNPSEGRQRSSRVPHTVRLRTVELESTERRLEIRDGALLGFYR